MRQTLSSFWQRNENAKWLMRYPAMTVMVFMRKDIGYRLLNPVPMLIMTGILAIVAMMIPPDKPDTKPHYLFWFAVASLFLASCQRTKRWREFKRGILQHSYYIGTSPFDFKWLPFFCRRFRRVGRFVDPFFCIILGFIMLAESAALGWWLLIAGTAVRIFEDAVHRKELNRDLDILDSLIISEVHGGTVEAFDDSAPHAPQSSSPPIPTGLAPDIKKSIRRRKNA